MADGYADFTMMMMNEEKLFHSAGDDEGSRKRRPKIFRFVRPNGD